MKAIDVGHQQTKDSLVSADDSARLHLRLLRALVLPEVLEYLEGFSLLVDVVDVDDAGGGAHVGGLQAAEVLEALPSVDDAVDRFALGLVALLVVALGEPGVVSQTYVGQKALLEERIRLHGFEALADLLLQPAFLSKCAVTSCSLMETDQTSTFSCADWIQRLASISSCETDMVLSSPSCVSFQPAKMAKSECGWE